MADAAAFAKAAEQVQTADGTKVSLTVAGMHCGDCSTKVTAALQGVDGVIAVAVDYQTGAAEIAYDAAKVDVAALVSAVEGTGFQATKKQDA
ncbi:MAG: heavy-metal-associated domain-containing protein [Alphaproteobacteria bacterium]|nr:heavy-metal-associated domain-containing protein [Alphaproteobacteria bacterium]